jgi:hypothetical protein
METIDKIIFGDNQFFGINHMSQEKARQLAEQFHDINNIFKVYDFAYKAGLKAYMLNSNDKAKYICDFFRDNRGKYPDITWYPSIPYPHKYANMVAEKGIMQTINEVLIADNSAASIIKLLAKGGSAILGKNVVKLMQLLVDMEMKVFKDMQIKVIFLQNIITDLLLGYQLKDIFGEYCIYIKRKYNALPGLITQNLPFLLASLKEWNIRDVVVCTSFNKIGYLMSPDINSYELSASNNDTTAYQILAMSTLASGAIAPRDAYNYINRQNIQAVVFGASTKSHIEETIKLIELN